MLNTSTGNLCINGGTRFQVDSFTRLYAFIVSLIGFVLFVTFVLALGIVLVIATNLSQSLLSHAQMYLSYASVAWRTTKVRIVTFGSSMMV